MNYQKEFVLEPVTQAFVDSTRKAWETLYTLPYADACQVLEGDVSANNNYANTYATSGRIRCRRAGQRRGFQIHRLDAR